MILQITGLTYDYPGSNGKSIKALRGIDFSLSKGESAAIVGESGCGKTTLCNILNLTLKNYGGNIVCDGHDLHAIPERKSFFAKVQYIFQDPKSAVSPYQKLAYFLTAPLINLKGLTKAEAVQMIRDRLPQIGLSADILNKRSDEVSLGQLQRLCLLKSLIIKPQLLLCDEITSALDRKAAQACLELIKLYQKEGMSVLFITHDMSLARNFCQRIAVMFKGTIVEDTCDPLTACHPYTKGLMDAAAFLKGSYSGVFNPEPALSCPVTVDQGCPYFRRCSNREQSCEAKLPDLTEISPHHYVRCFKFTAKE